MALKCNLETLHDAVVEYADQHAENDFAGIAVRRPTTTESAHARDTTRCYFPMPVPIDFVDLDLWKGLPTIGVAISACVRDGNETVETRYSIGSLPVGVKRFARAVRGHWGIDNTCHWTLDTTFREGESRIRDAPMRENFAWRNRFVLSLLKQHPGKDSLIGKRRGCGWNDDSLLEVLTGTGS